MTTISSDSNDFQERPLASSARQETSITGLREERMQQCLREALESKSADLAALGAATVGLLNIGAQLEGTITKHLQYSSDSVDKLNSILPAMDMLHKYVRQQERCVRLKMEIKR